MFSLARDNSFLTPKEAVASRSAAHAARLQKFCSSQACAVAERTQMYKDMDRILPGTLQRESQKQNQAEDR